MPTPAVKPIPPKVGNAAGGIAPRRFDSLTLAGLLVALGGILGGMMIEGGQLREVFQPTAAMIVFGGTAGALMITTSRRVLGNAIVRLADLFFEADLAPTRAIDMIVQFAAVARKTGLISLESEISSIREPFFRKAMTLAVDGADAKEIRAMMELELGLEAYHYEESARVFTAAGGYAPTIGIIGAVLGLMQVMKNLQNIDEVGKGIATAFVATIYGVGAANVLLLPAGNKIRARFQATRLVRELTIEGVVAIVEGLNPKLIRTKLDAYPRHWSVRLPGRPAEKKAAVGNAAPERSPA